MRDVIVPREGLPVTTARRVANDATTGRSFSVSADVVIIGSGAGGSVAAYELAKAGRKVVVLESGRYLPSSAFTEHLGDTMTLIYKDQAGQLNSTADVLFVEGHCVGGSTVIGACVMQRPSDAQLREWVDRLGLSALSPENLNPLFLETGTEQYVHLNEAHEINATAHKVVQGCERLGFHWRPVARNVRQCALTGHCLAGCPSDRKMSALVSHLPWAVAYGARIYSDARVDRIIIQHGRARGVEATIRDPDNGELVAKMRVDADVVVSAAGALETPMLLQRSQARDYSGQIGKNLSIVPFTQVLGQFKEVLEGFRGALVGVQVDEFMHSEGLMFFSALAEPEQIMAQGDPRVGDEHIALMKSYKHLAGLNVFAVDEGNGEVNWKGGIEDGRKVISWNPSMREFDRMKRAVSLASRVFFAAGAEKVYLPSFQRLEANSVFELDDAIKQVSYGIKGLYTYRTNSFSPQGTCRMGVDRMTSVTSQDGEVHDVAGLFVADASLMPEPIAAAPHWTVQVLAKHVARRILARSEGLFLS